MDQFRDCHAQLEVIVKLCISWLIAINQSIDDTSKNNTIALKFVRNKVTRIAPGFINNSYDLTDYKIASNIYIHYFRTKYHTKLFRGGSVSIFVVSITKLISPRKGKKDHRTTKLTVIFVSLSVLFLRIWPQSLNARFHVRSKYPISGRILSRRKIAENNYCISCSMAQPNESPTAQINIRVRRIKYSL